MHHFFFLVTDTRSHNLSQTLHDSAHSCNYQGRSMVMYTQYTLRLWTQGRELVLRVWLLISWATDTTVWCSRWCVVGTDEARWLLHFLGDGLHWKQVCAEWSALVPVLYKLQLPEWGNGYMYSGKLSRNVGPQSRALTTTWWQATFPTQVKTNVSQLGKRWSPLWVCRVSDKETLETANKAVANTASNPGFSFQIFVFWDLQDMRNPEW